MTVLCSVPTLMLIITLLSAQGPTIEDLQRIYEKSRPGEMPCYYDGTICRRGEEFCSTKSKTCESPFPMNATENEKLGICAEVIKNQVQEQGVYDTCIYFRGYLAVKEDTFAKHAKKKLIHQHDSSDLYSTGKELCPYANFECQLGKECCNPASKKCELLFPEEIPVVDKWHHCQGIVKNKESAVQHDSCIYLLGLLSWKIDNYDDYEDKLKLALGLSLGLGIPAGAVITIVVIAVIKWRFYKKNTTDADMQRPDNRAPQENGGTVDRKEAKDLLTAHRENSAKTANQNAQNDAQQELTPE